ncbi:hypothetical protein ABIC45_002916 [Mucilaginibacter rubeus]|uniref:BamA/TamA family outer membrane protein n=1 Tax=Mucilaginibacter rubeus TaxID=2027860 RepID=UPI00339792AE
MRSAYLSILALAISTKVFSQVQDKNFPDSVSVTIHPHYNQVSKVHRKIFGENYRQEWATAVKLPLIRISRINGGLTPERNGGGMETKSIRLSDKNGQVWVLRSVEKIPDKLVPENLRQTFALDWVDDAYSGQHPYSALMVPPLAEAARVPHANPVIGVLEADPALGDFGKEFAGRVVLFEEREPLGASDNTQKMLKEVNGNYNVRLDGKEVLRSRMLDLLVGDWDRHEDQWRWHAVKNEDGKVYLAVPRDRDQVLHVVQGLLPGIAAQPWIDPVLGDFTGSIPHVKYSLMKTQFMQPYTDVQLSYAEWMKVVNEFCAAESDLVLETAVKRLPVENQQIRGEEILQILKERRSRIPAAMSDYYKFINRIVDLKASDKSEFISVSARPDATLAITISKVTRSGKPGEVLSVNEYDPAITKEIRLYTGAGNDHLVIDTRNSPVRLRVIDSAGLKKIDMVSAAAPVKLYGKKDSALITGRPTLLKGHFSNDTANLKFVRTNPYNVWMPLATGAINRDDGFLLGIGFRYTGNTGFRKTPNSTIQELLITHSFKNEAFRISYSGQWMSALGKADITLAARADAPDNTMNFFGQGNHTALDETGDYHRFYRARFDFYQLDAALRWHIDPKTTFSAGPSLQYYHYNENDNVGRSVTVPGSIRSYDSVSYRYDKTHAGLALSLISDRRNNNILPSSGWLLQVNGNGYAGLNRSSKAYAQVKPEFTYFLKVDSGARLVLSDRLGGGVTVGDAAFYQSMFLGGQGNLLGYLQNRFAGQQMAYNNFQARLRIAEIPGYVLPGQLGLTGFYDIGRVWLKGEKSGDWHQGAGGGLYFVPAGLTVIQVLAGHSSEGWYPYISLNFRL